ncbi:MAG: DUF998 domain-containing protein [Actinobacteria bacterium]|uniref:Unannotated protein n=1 Tax=freshwater metagenome TaxID=449393 RepID=A0A6J6GJ65_9ZZZZ|nr:DUF998 domain-containing protein [Actinomycetota bacterium]
MERIEKPAFVAAIIGPIQSVLGWTIAGALWVGYDPVKQTISDLAANESPVQGIMSAFFVLGGILTLIAAVYAKTFAMPGRVALFVAAICTFGLTIFPTPLVGYSLWHRIFAISSFVLSAGWHLFAMRTRKDAPWILKPPAAIIGTALQTALALWFLSTWTDPNATDVGVWERVVAVSQSLYVSVVVIVIYLGQRSKGTSL